MKKKRRSRESEDARSELKELLSLQQQPSNTSKLTYTLLPGEDSVWCPQWRMKKHSARVAPLSSYSTQVLTCPNFEGKLKDPKKPKMPFILY